ncbi:hypothetical protein TRFO_39228 [Tritrichomonas foetus]|uniref:BEACH domain-containing protein n=1 Tax=Tritrichomonas foetus TaxID=1144522 RepID=A0A1J4J5R1_9EUKA|nr:hypothetical protein TRFO_39228 [Tritrichomonas foetus]|eukprot:OHS94574.1 hypothetical protein TRFO_39228 [Tritrichomonas foetus]
MQGKVKRFLNFKSGNAPQNKLKNLFGAGAENDLKEFQKLANSLNDVTDFQAIEECAVFYLDKIQQIDSSIIASYGLVPHLTKIVEYFVPLLHTNIHDKSKWEIGFCFLTASVSQVASSSPSLIQPITDLIITIMETNDIDLLDFSKYFVTACLSTPETSTCILTFENLVNVWNSVFVINDLTSFAMADLFINTVANNIQYQSVDEVQPFLDNVLLTFCRKQFKSTSMYPKCLEFICTIMKNINTDPFIDVFVETLKPILKDIPDLSFFGLLLAAKTNRVHVAWDLVNEICQDSETNMTKIRTFVDIFKQVKDLSYFKSNLLIPRFASFSNEDQQTLLEILKNQSNEYKFAFICNSCPPWANKLKPAFFESLVTSGNYDEAQIQTILDIFIRTQESFFRHANVIPVKRIVDYLFSNVTQSMAIVSDLLLYFMEYLNKNESDSIYEMAHKLFIKGNHEFLVQAVVKFFQKNEEVKDKIFVFISDETLKYEDISKYFRANGEIFNLIKKYLDRLPAVDFLAALANDGPCVEIDDFIIKNFEDSPLSKLEPKYLNNLMLGLSSDSCYDGLIRIPPLCKYIDEVPIKTPFDKYMVANKFKLTKKKDIIKCSTFFIQARNLEMDSTFLKKISSPDSFHFSVYQSHYSMRHSYARFPTSVTASIWIYFEKLIKETVIISSPTFKIYVGLEELRVNDLEPVQFPLMSWQLLTISRVNPTFGSSMLEIYLNDKKIAEILIKNALTEPILIGSEDNNFAIWYISQNVQIMDTQPQKTDFQNMIKKGPSAYSPIKLTCGPGMPFLFYRGIASFKNNFNIFILLLGATKEEDFRNYFIVANNLWKIGVIQPNKFYAGIRYVVSQRPQFNVEDLMHSVEFIKDFQLLGMDSLKYEWIKDISNVDYFVKYLIDVVIFFNLSEAKVDLFVDVISKYLKNHPDKISNLFMMIEILTNDIRIQRKMFRFYTINADAFSQYVTKQRLYQLIQCVPDLFALEVLDYISPRLYDLQMLEACYYRFISLVSYDQFWLSMFSFLLMKKVEDFDQCVQFQVKNPSLFHLMFKILTKSLRHNVSVRVLSSLVILINTVHTTQFIDSIRLLCSLGYTTNEANVSNISNNEDECTENSQQTNSSSPTNENSIEPEQPSQNQIQSQNSGSILTSIISYKNVPVNQISESHYEETMQYLNENFRFDENAKDYDFQSLFPEYKGLSKLEESHIEVISEACARILLRSSKNTSKFRMKLVKFSIQGNNVIKEIAILMHRSITMKLLSNQSNMSNKIADVLGQFLINRIFDGWWEGHVFEIFTAMSPYFTTSNFAKEFIAVCILKGETEVNKIITTFMNMKSFKDLIVKEPFQNYMIEVLNQNNLITSQKSFILRVFPSSEFTKSIHDDTYQWYVSNSPNISKAYNDLTQKIIKTNTDNLKLLVQTRADLAIPSIKPHLINFFKSVDRKIAYQLAAFRYQFYIRHNRSNFLLESLIHDLYYDYVRLTPPAKEKYMIVPSTSPFIVPQKMVPISYHCDLPFGANFKKTNVPIPVATYESNNLELKDKNDELLRKRVAPSCFQKINLPSFATSVNITRLFKETFDIAINTHIFTCSFLSYIEGIPCVGCFTKDDSFVLLLHSKVVNSRVQLIEDSYANISFGLAYSRIAGGYCGKWSLFMNHVVLKLPFSEVLEAIPRKHTYLNIALEIYTISGYHLSFLFSERERKQFLSKIKMPQRFNSVESYTKAWLNGEMTNFDYLMALNILGSRSFNDLSQYPVFPWVISDHKSEEIEALNLPETSLRKLERPIGVQTDDRIERFVLVYNETDPPYHYGSHYSNPAHVLHYMLRVEPHTMLNLHLHSGWDHKDRLFCDVVESWKSVSESKQTDTKELIPEFYCNPTIFDDLNNKINLPPRTDGHPLDKVSLPPWAKNNPVVYVWKMRMALESSQTRQNLNNWIDLIFGFKQRGQAAIDAINVYQPYCYDTCLKEKNEEDELSIEADHDAMINFGQCPTQLFLQPHPNSQEVPNKLTTNLLNSERRISRLKNFPKNTNKLRYIESSGTLITASNQEIYLGGEKLNISNDKIENPTTKTILNFDDYIICNTTSYTTKHAAIALKNGSIHVVREDYRVMPTIYANCAVVNMAMSEKHFLLVCQSSMNWIKLFDICSGRLIRKMQPRCKEKLVKIAFDDACDFIILSSANSIEVVGLDFRPIAFIDEMPNSSPITAMSIASPYIWNDRPFFITGHANGHCYLWEIDVCNGKVKETWIMENNLRPITAVYIFAQNKVAIAVDDCGTAVMASIMNIQRKLIKASYFETCAICAEQLDPKKTNICENCRLAVCCKCTNQKFCIGCKAFLADQTDV